MAMEEFTAAPPNEWTANEAAANSHTRDETGSRDPRPDERPAIARALAATLFVNVIAVLAILTAGIATLSAIGA